MASGWSDFLTERAITATEVYAAIILLDPPHEWPLTEVARVIKRDREALALRVRRERRKAAEAKKMRMTVA